MRKTDVIAAVADTADLSPRQAELAVSAILEQITNALGRGENVNLVGFGSFTVKTRAARSGRNPKNGELIAIAGSRTPGFKPGKNLKDSVQNT